MGLKSYIIRQFAHHIARQTQKAADNAINDQEAIFRQLIKKAKNTKFGRDHGLAEISDYASFKNQVPVIGYEEMKLYIEAIIEGESDVLWPGRPKYFAKTSGTTSGVKYIPITKESIPYHINTARNAILNYIAQTGHSIFSGNMIFLSGSPELELKAGIKTGRLSGIVNHEVPSWVKPNQIPDYKTNCIEDWEEKLDKLVDISLQSNMSLISGIPPWVQMYYELLLKKSGKSTVKELFPEFQLFIHGGVNYQPYKARLEALAGSGVDTLETYPASEGFIAYQNDKNDHGLLLNTNAGMFFEFIPADKFFDENPERLSLKDVKIETDYALVISSNAGLWAYSLGDTVRFTQLNPYKLIVSGRIKHFISAFGEHVIAKEVEEALQLVAADMGLQITEFTVAPQVTPPEGGLPYHEWLIEFEKTPDQLDIIAHKIDEEIIRQNIYYRDLIEGRILQTLKIKPLRKNSFVDYMKSLGKLGGQNKVPRLTNDRKIADALIKISRENQTPSE
jgi:hypothetical protein